MDGILYAILVAIMASAILFIIPIQEKITGDIEINAHGLPLAVKTQEAGQIYYDLQDGSSIAAGEFLASQTWNINQVQLAEIEKMVNTQITYFTYQELGELEEKIADMEAYELPELKGELQEVASAIEKFKILESGSNPSEVLSSLENQIQDQISSASMFDSLGQSYLQQLQVIESQLRRDSVLAQQNILSPREYEDRKVRLLEQRSVIIDNEIDRKNATNLVGKLRGDIATTLNSYEQRRASFKLEILNALISLRKKYSEVSQNKILRSPISGKILLQSEINSSDYLPDGTTVMQIIPHEGQQRMESFLFVAPHRVGDIKPDQNVFIELAEYTVEEYGSVRAKVLTVDPLLTNGRYRVHVKMPFPLTTNFPGIKLPVQPYYHGKAIIFTNRMTVFDKIKRDIMAEKEKLMRG